MKHSLLSASISMMLAAAPMSVRSPTNRMGVEAIERRPPRPNPPQSATVAPTQQAKGK